MPSNKFYCGAILFFAGILLSTLTTIVVFMVAPPGNSNNGTGTEGKVMVKIKVKQGTSATPTHDQGRPLLSSAPTPSPIKTSLPNLVSTPPAVPVPVSPTGPAARSVSPSSPRTLANRSQLTPSLQTITASFSGGQTTLPRQINHTRTSQITTSRLLVQVTNLVLAPPTSTTSALHTAASLRPKITTRTSPIPTRSSPITTQASPITTQTSPITTQTYPITTQTTSITSQTTPIITRTSPITTSPTIPSCSKNETTRIFAGNGEISSPGFPNPYPSNMCHTWVFETSPGKRVQVNFLYFDVENFYKCKYDSVAIVVDGSLLGQKLYCGRGDYPIPFPPKINGTKIEVTMVSDGQDQEMGFKLEYGTLPEHG